MRRGTVNAPVSKYNCVAMIRVTPLATADPPEKKCLPRPGTIVTGSCTECLESIYMVQHLYDQNPLTTAIKAMVSRYIDYYGRVQLHVVVHFIFNAH